ncbi:type I restriction-modification enzyme, S subunit [Aeromonas caviae]|uniref:restriction endonuclease subunit S n=2 Tax=Aeromonas caviae TaxID=648 RepID=UPI001FBBE72E|nr:restriction endonuclease subunit S [Aeromonas caviae]GKR02783.1 type I restriction-modification enzyme, S subunit [Aeromonas caviae]GKR11697.1 type I restriction-modification enzyme, S subunit [Aeromonas caviae]GKR15965.1 type I restriction-modification enzyme, S subunit [Aeromonas caviae]GKR40977.1 type I restriction-modification enzyme, S subunit [Aeromonas caviae]GKR58171.1 type I restriction-modification enzyme, S subunit [Aeromonas caviae]
MAEQMKQNKAGEMAAKQIIPAGYKLSEAGIIPEDWEALPLGGICKVQGGFAFKSERFKKTGVPILRISNIQSGYLDVNEVVYYSVGEKIPKQFEVNDGDALIAMSGATTGKVGIYNENGVAYLNQRVGKFVLHGNADIRYIQHVVGSDLYKIALNNMLEQGAQPNISSSQLERIVIRKPTIEIEQKIIADVLSDTDKLIACLAQLIAKKQAIKTATMQQLLTGRTRLPQFALRPDGTPKGYKSSELGQIPEDWGINSINKVGSIITGSTPPTAVGCYWDGDIPWITPTDIGDAKNIFESERRITEKGLQEIRGLPANSVLVTCIASIGKNAILKNAGACNQQINAIVPTALFDVDFLYYNIEFSKERLRQCAGITATPIISKALFSDFLLPFPSNKEQTAIATILSDMDSELQALEQKLAKARDVKQGMMQQLLTGRIRLPLEVGV